MLSVPLPHRFGVFVLTSCLLLLFSVAFSQGRNPFRLPLVTSKKSYRQSVADSAHWQMVPLDGYIKPYRTDIVYATANNFTGKVLYKKPTLFLRREAAEKLQAVQDSLAKKGLGLLIYDAYRPYAVTRAMWRAVPDDRYAANPKNGSGHNRGVAVDLTLVNLSNGEKLPMPTGFDNFSDTAHYSFTQLPEEVLQNRSLLQGVMQHFGFLPLDTEWWHFYLPNPRQYPLMDLSFAKLRKWTAAHP